MFFFQSTRRKEFASRACKARNVIKLTNKVENWFLLLWSLTVKCQSMKMLTMKEIRKKSFEDFFSS